MVKRCQHRSSWIAGAERFWSSSPRPVLSFGCVERGEILVPVLLEVQDSPLHRPAVWPVDSSGQGPVELVLRL